LPKKVNQTEYR